MLKKILLWGLAIIVVLGIIGAVSGGGEDASVAEPNPKVTATEDPTEEPAAAEEPAKEKKAEKPAQTKEPKPTPEPKPEPQLSAGAQQAVRSAQSYLDFSNFSRTGLIDQLVFEDYSRADATAAVDSMRINYRNQAAGSAKSYLEMSGFSRQGLIDQLVFEGYTQAQAAYGVTQAGL